MMSSSAASLEAASESKRRSIVILSLIATCTFLFVLCLCLLSALVLVGKNFSAQTSPLLLSSYFAGSISEKTSVDEVGGGAKQKTPKSIDHFNRPALFDEDSALSPDRTEDNRTALTLPNSVYSGTSPGMNVVKMAGSKVLEKLTFRLPRHIKPRHYDLLMSPDLDQQTFTGQVGIDVTVSEPTDYFVVHSNQLSISETVLKKTLPDKSEQPVTIRRTYPYDLHQYWVIETESVQAGEYRLSMSFNGSLANRIVGFYSSSYRDKGSNTTRKIATSKFEPTFARQAFPCFDEPQLKATYTISLVHPSDSGYEALSNMNVDQTLPNNPSAGLSTTVFNRSVPMSTYLVVFIVSDFQYQASRITPNIGSAFDLRVYATQFQMDNVKFARETAKGVIEHYIDYFQIPYPLPKLDMAAIPDFVSGAMETWGLVTYRETSLLYDEKTSSTANKQRVAEVIAHELAHDIY